MSNITPSVSALCQDVKSGVDTTMNQYAEKFDDATQDTEKPTTDEIMLRERLEKAETITEGFYNLVTDFYEYGWGQSFHFAPLYDGKSFEECIASYEQECGKMIAAKPGMKILDVGCGVGGPGREIAQYSGANVVGLNYNSYQIERAKKHTRSAQLDKLCTYIKGDFCNMTDIADNSFDGGFAYEATCHSKSLVMVYKEIYRVLKPGALFADMAWCVTDDYNPQDPRHVKVMNGVMYGNSLPKMRTQVEILAALREVGFEVVEFRDLIRDGDTPWYHTLSNNNCCSLKNFRMTSTGRLTTNYLLGALEAVSVVPKGTSKVSSMLEVAAKSLIESGKLGIFSPMFRCLARKPAE